MKKSELIQEISRRTEIPKSISESVVNALIGTIEDALVRDDKVTLLGFGTFKTKHRSESSGINPRTGDEIFIPATRYVSFKAGAKLKANVKSASKGLMRSCIQ